MSSPTLKTSKNWLLWLLIVALCLGVTVWLYVSVQHVTSPRVVAHATMPNGVEIMIKQSFTWSGDLFNTSFHYRRPGGKWVWRYYSHEDGYWGEGRVNLDPSKHVATVYRGSQPTIEFNWDTLVHTQFTETQGGSPRTFDPASDR